MSGASGPAAAGAGSKLDVIRKLLAKAERAATWEEAEAYTAKAVELSARHGIDAALLAADHPGSDGVGRTRMPVPGRYSAAHARLLGWVAEAMGCRAVLHGMRGGRVSAVTVFGHASDRERVGLLHASLLLQVVAQLDRLRPPDPHESVAAYRRSWLLGFAAEVQRRVAAAEAAAQDEVVTEQAGAAGTGAVALVLAERHRQVESAYADAYPALGRARRPAWSGSGYGAGADAGARADLGRGSAVRAAPVRAISP